MRPPPARSPCRLPLAPLPLHLPAPKPRPPGTQHHSETEMITSAVLKTEEAGQPAGRAPPAPEVVEGQERGEG